MVCEKCKQSGQFLEFKKISRNSISSAKRIIIFTHVDSILRYKIPQFELSTQWSLGGYKILTARVPV